MNVLIIEDDLLFATRLEAIISETAHLFVGHCNSAAEVPHWLTNNSCDVALIDIHLGKGLNGIDNTYFLFDILKIKATIFVNLFI